MYVHRMCALETAGLSGTVHQTLEVKKRNETRLQDLQSLRLPHPTAGIHRTLRYSEVQRKTSLEHPSYICPHFRSSPRIVLGSGAPQTSMLVGTRNTSYSIVCARPHVIFKTGDGACISAPLVVHIYMLYRVLSHTIIYINRTIAQAVILVLSKCTKMLVHQSNPALPLAAPPPGV